MTNESTRPANNEAREDDHQHTPVGDSEAEIETEEEEEEEGGANTAVVNGRVIEDPSVEVIDDDEGFFSFFFLISLVCSEWRRRELRREI